MSALACLLAYLLTRHAVTCYIKHEPIDQSITDPEPGRNPTSTTPTDRCACFSRRSTRPAALRCAAAAPKRAVPAGTEWRASRNTHCTVEAIYSISYPACETCKCGLAGSVAGRGRARETQSDVRDMPASQPASRLRVDELAPWLTGSLPGNGRIAARLMAVRYL